MTVVLLAGMTSMASADAAPRPGVRPTVGATAPRLATGATQTCFGPDNSQYPDCASSDPAVTLDLFSIGDTTGCTFTDTVTWADGSSSTMNTPGGPNGTLLLTFTHTYTAPDPMLGPSTYAIGWTSDVDTGMSCTNNSGTGYFTLACTASELSGPAWAQQFPGSTSINALSTDHNFMQNVQNFKNAMGQAGIAVNILATLRPPQRAYMMHWSWMIAKAGYAPQAVPAFVPSAGQAPVNVCWEHTDANGNYDAQASVDAAEQMAQALGVANLSIAPALKSLHTKGLAIDMTTTWSAPSITIIDGNGQPVPINTSPRTGLNTTLMQVGYTYNVFHFCYPPGTCQTKVPSNDANHWSYNGH